MYCRLPVRRYRNPYCRQAREVSRIEMLLWVGGYVASTIGKTKAIGVVDRSERGFFRRGRRNGGKRCRRANGRKYGTRKRSDSLQDRRRSMS